jgi:hypothetical protein
MSRKFPLIVNYHRLGYLLTEECWAGNNKLIDTHPSKYLIHGIEWYFVGKLVLRDNGAENIVPLSSDEFEKVNSKGWRYQYNSRPNTHWDSSQIGSKAVMSNGNFEFMSLKDLINEVRKRDPNLIKKYLSSKPPGTSLTKPDCLNILNTTLTYSSFYPLCNTERLLAFDFLNWIYYVDYQCWIDKMGDRCHCIKCYPLRNPEDFSLANFKNRHCVNCSCEDCICQCHKLLDENGDDKKKEFSIVSSNCKNCEICNI